MSSVSDERTARAVLTAIVDPSDTVLGGLVEQFGAVVLVDMITRRSVGASRTNYPAMVERRLQTWGRRLATTQAPSLSDFISAGGRFVIPGDSEWPVQLDDLGHRAPVGLWVHGCGTKFPITRSVAIAGSRSATRHGLHMASQMATELAGLDYAIVSGGALGIDAASHQAALNVNGATVAVLPCAVDVSYPKTNTVLFERIAQQGLLVSELPPGRSATRMTFLSRNRIIAALATVTLIIEAGVPSGSLNTAKHAAELGRPLLAVPGPSTSPRSAGTNRLITTGQAVSVPDTAAVVSHLVHEP